MLEPDIKYENCEELYTGPGTITTNTSNNHSNGRTSQMVTNGEGIIGDPMSVVNAAVSFRPKRSYSEHAMHSLMVGSGQGLQQDAFSRHSYNMMSTAMMGAGGNQNYYALPPQQQQPATQNAEVKVKRQRRYESSILFQHPFFNLLEDWDSARSGEAITAKCLSCKVTLRGHKNVSSNFIKHMKRLHPELYKVYENYKLLKFKGWNTIDGGAGGSVGTGQDNAEQGFFDASMLLEHMVSPSVEELNSTETSSTPPTEVLDASDANTAEAQQQKPSTDAAEQSKATNGGGGGGSGGAVRLVSQERILNSKPLMRSEVDLSTKTLQQMSQMLDAKLTGFITVAQLQDERKTMLQLIDNKLEESLNQSQADDTISITPTEKLPPASNVNIRDKFSAAEPTSSTASSASSSVTANATVAATASAKAVQIQIDQLKAECATLRDAVKRAQQSKQHLQAEVQAIDQAMRQRKIFARNMPLLNAAEKPKQLAERLVHQLLQLPDAPVKSAFLLSSATTGGGGGGIQNNANKSRHNLVFELMRASDATLVLRNCSKLKNTGIMLEHALGPHALGRKHKLLVLRREMLRRNPALKILVRNTEMFVGGKQFYWDAVDGLCVLWGQQQQQQQQQQDNLFNTSANVVEVLKETTGLDMTEFLNVLRNYNIK